MGKEENNSTNWEAILASEGMPSNLSDDSSGERVDLGDGLGRKTDAEEATEDSGEGHSTMCPINLGKGININVDQPNDRPVERDMEIVDWQVGEIRFYGGATVKKRTHDYMAYVGFDESRWESGKTVKEALQKLKISHPGV